jgi:hypothetical protein
METKVCSKCKQEKFKTDFYPRKERGINGVRSKCKVCCSESQKLNRDKTNEYCRKSYRKHAESQREKAREYRRKNLEKVLETERKSNTKHREKRIKYTVQYTRERRKTDELFYLRYKISNNIYESFKKLNSKKTNKYHEILGCDISFFAEYIKSKFKKGMTIYNHGEWHLDHIIPLSTAKTKEDIIRLCHYTNYQPLWAKENLMKSNKIKNQQLNLL